MQILQWRGMYFQHTGDLCKTAESWAIRFKEQINLRAKPIKWGPAKIKRLIN